MNNKNYHKTSHGDYEEICIEIVQATKASTVTLWPLSIAERVIPQPAING